MITFRTILITLLLAGSAAAQVVPGGSSSGGSLPAQAGYDATLSGVMANQGTVCQDATTSVSTGIVTTANACFNSGMVGQLAFVTNGCSTGQCGFVNLVTSTTVSPSTQTKVARVASFQSATQITLDCNTPANCVSPNASSAQSGHGTVVVLTDQVTALNAAFVAALATPGCPNLLLPTGYIGFSGPIFTASLIPAGNRCTSINNNLFTFAQYGYENTGPTIKGSGSGSTIFVPLPNFNWTGTGGCSTTGAAIGGADGVSYEDFSIFGFGQSLLLSGLPVACVELFEADSGRVHNVHGEGWANSTSAAQQGFEVVAGFMLVSDSEFVAFGGGGSGAGGATCNFGGDSVQVVNLNCIAGGAGASIIVTGYLQSTNLTVGPPSRQNTPVMVVTPTGFWQDVNGRCEGTGTQWGQTAPTSIINVQAGGFLYQTNFTNQCSATAGSTGITNAGTYVADLYKVFPGFSFTTGVNNSGTFFDSLTGNSYGGPVTNTGVWIGSGSVNVTPVTAAKLVLSAGWGSTAAVTALTGGDAPIQFTITNSGTGQGASPTITYTFPTPYPVAPFSCAATDLSGTNPLLNPFTTSSLTATGAVFTATGTPTVSDTEIMQITCVTP